MSEIHKFVKKFTDDLKNITCRKAYGLDAFFMGEKIFIIITRDQKIALKADDYQTGIDLAKISGVSKWILDGKEMQNWHILPSNIYKKKNKLYPILEVKPAWLYEQALT